MQLGQLCHGSGIDNLHVFVDHPGWMAELERLKRPLLIKLQASYRELRIRRIQFLLLVNLVEP